MASTQRRQRYWVRQALPQPDMPLLSWHTTIPVTSCHRVRNKPYLYSAGAFDEVEPFEDVRPGLERLREAGIQVNDCMFCCSSMSCQAHGKLVVCLPVRLAVPANGVSQRYTHQQNKPLCWHSRLPVWLHSVHLNHR